ncbi:putative pectate lyase [Helianthus annuus]|nr:putative pectate lyase [Helianthus annuus]KAJ0885172.1 putative pectate lyase [Helianthus annuus]
MLDTAGGCLTGNPIDDCWRCDPNWANKRQCLADCAIGFGKSAFGGKGGQIYVITDSSDNDVVNPTPGTLRHAVMISRRRAGRNPCSPVSLWGEIESEDDDALTVAVTVEGGGE